jgi:hypothetical protein
MIKKGLLFVLIAVVSAGVLFIGCDNGTTSTSGGALPPPTPEGLEIDRTVSNETDLKAVLENGEVDAVAFVLSASTPLSEGITIPEGKIVYLLTPSSGAPVVLTPATAGLQVRGALVVSENTSLHATNTQRVFLGRNGSIKIEAGGSLRTDKLNSVTDLPDQGTGEASVLSRVSYAGSSTLTIDAEPGLSPLVIGELLNAIPPGISRSSTVSVNGPSRLELVSPLTAVKPSEIEGIQNVSLERRVSLIPAETEDETTTGLTIPAGAEVRITQNLPQITSLVVDGTLNALVIGNGTAPVTVTVNGSATVTTAIKFDPTSAISGVFNGTAVDGKIPALPGAVINNSVVKPGDGALTTVAANVTAALSVPVGEIYQIVGSLNATAAITVAGTLEIPTGSSLNFDTGSSIVGTSEGKIIVEGVVSVASGVTVDGLVYAIDTTANSNPAGHKYTIKSVTRDLKTKTSTIVLSGTVTGGITSGTWAHTNVWGAKGSSAPDSGLWTWATITGILNSDALTPDTVIKQYNQSFIYYKGDASNPPADTDDESKLTPIPEQNHPNIYIPASGTGIYKIKKYTETHSPADVTATNGFGVLFYSAANPKTATIQIKPAEAGTPPATPTKAYTVVVDWSDVTINDK